MDVLDGRARDLRAPHSFAGFLACPLLLLFLLLQVAFARAQSSSTSVHQPASAGSIDLPSFQAGLRRIRVALAANHLAADQIAALLASLPSTWAVETPERVYQISSDPLRLLLEDARKDPAQRAQRVEQAQEWVGGIAAEVGGYAAASEQSQIDAHAKLDRILAAPEFATVYQQTAWDRFKQRVTAWIWQRLSALAERIGRQPALVQFLFWLILLGAVAAVGLLLFRAWIRRAHFDEFEAPAAPAIKQTWQEWVHAAQLAANSGAYRDAVHSLYWAGIVYLEDSRVIPRERWRTPRERLRQLPSSTQVNAGETTKRREVLQALTARLERVWYAGRPATQQDFIESSHLVQELGCRWQ